MALTLVVLGFAFTGYASEEWAHPRLAGSNGRLRFLSSRQRRPSPAAVEAPATGPILSVRDLVVHYDRRGPAVVRGVSFDAERERVTALVGESGSGGPGWWSPTSRRRWSTPRCGPASSP